MTYPLETLKIMAQNASDLTADPRAMSEKCRDYYDGYQLTDGELAELRKRKQPPVIYNRIKRKIDAMVGIEQRSRTDPRALPRTPNDEQAADTATKALVFIDDTTRFDAKRSMAFENLIVEGYGGAEVVVEPKIDRKTGQQRMEVVVNRLRWEEIIFDPASREKDFSDAAYVGSMKWMTLDKAEELYGEQYSEILQQTAATEGQTFEDRPVQGAPFKWGDKKLRRVRVVQMYYRAKGVWNLAIFTGGGEIFNQPSPYLDDEGQPTCPIVLMSAYVDRENRRYGIVQDMLSAQDEVNKRRSKSLHMLNSRQTMTAKGAVVVSDMKRELAKPDGNVEVDPIVADGAREAGIPAFQVLANNDQLEGHIMLLAEAKNEIDMVGPNASLLGQLEGDHSGRAIMAQQQAGMAELSPIYDSLRDWTLRCYRQMWMRVRQYWTEERWVRVTDEISAPQFVGLNQVVGQQVMMGPDGMAQVVPQIENSPAQMDVDIIIDEAPDIVTLRQEEFEQLSALAERGIPIPPQALIEASSVRNKQKLVEAMDQQNGQAQAMQQQMAAMQMQIEQLKAQADAQLKAAQTEKVAAETAEIVAGLPGVAADARSRQVEGSRAEFEAQVDPLGMRNAKPS